MKIDKQNGKVCYSDADHVYWDETTKQKYISVTTLIGKYEQPFDKDFWSLYKAVEKTLTPEQFKTQKKRMLDTKAVKLDSICSDLDVDKKTILSAQQDILDEWYVTNKESTDRGTKIHNDLENAFYKTSTCDLKKYNLGGTFNCKKNYYHLDLDKGVYPEFLVHRESEDGVLRLAGQVDLLIKDGNDIYIFDYKGLSLDTPIATKDGWTTMNDIREGDLVFDRDGNLTTVDHVSEVHHNPCFKITFDNKDEIICDHEHKWIVSFRRSKGKHVEKTLTTEEIYNFMLGKPRVSYNIPKIKCTKPLNTQDVELPIDPYVFGAWLGDGTTASGAITNINPDFWQEIKNRGYSVGKDIGGIERSESRTILNIHKYLVKLGVLNNKHIPDIYMRASHKQRLDLLRGFMDTDGYFNKSRKRFVMATTQKWQADDTCKLVSSLGWKPTLINAVKYCSGKEFDGYDVCFNATENPFLIRNQDCMDYRIQNSEVSLYRNIEKIEKIETVPTKCIAVDSPSHTYLAGYNLIPTHNTNKKLDKTSFFNQKKKQNEKMLYPLNDLMNCNFSFYTLQLSMYAWMVQKYNPDFNIKKLMIIHYDHDGNVTEHEVEYLKDHVERMLTDYKKSVIIEERKNRDKRIEF